MFDIISFDDHLTLKPFGGGSKNNRLNNMYPGENESTNVEEKKEVETTQKEEATSENVAVPNGEVADAETKEEATEETKVEDKGEGQE